MGEYGYHPSGAPAPGRDDLAAYRRSTAAGRRRWRRLGVVERVARLREPGPVAALLTSRQRALAGLPPLPAHPDPQPHADPLTTLDTRE
jgi:hypothetical protein